MTIYCDNQSVIDLTNHQIYHEKTKHINVRLHSIRNVQFRVVRTMKITSNEIFKSVFKKVFIKIEIQMLLEAN